MNEREQFEMQARRLGLNPDSKLYLFWQASSAQGGEAVPLGYVNNSYNPGDLKGCVVDLFGCKSEAYYYPVYTHPAPSVPDKWIPCSEIEPPHNECVDAWAAIIGGYSNGDAERIPDVFYNRETGQWWHWDEGCIEEQVIQGMEFTHWMKRPAPPEQESE